MAYNESLAQRVREALAGQAGVVEKKMFGGLTFMIQGNMGCGILGAELMVRVGADHYEAALNHPHTHPMDFTGRPMNGFVVVAPDGLASDDSLADWVRQGLQFALTLPPK